MRHTDNLQSQSHDTAPTSTLSPLLQLTSISKLPVPCAPNSFSNCLPGRTLAYLLVQSQHIQNQISIIPPRVVSVIKKKGPWKDSEVFFSC